MLNSYLYSTFKLLGIVYTLTYIEGTFQFRDKSGQKQELDLFLTVVKA